LSSLLLLLLLLLLPLLNGQLYYTFEAHLIS